MDKYLNFLLASLLSSYPDAKFPEFVGTLLSDPNLGSPPDLKGALDSICTEPLKLDELRSQYIDLFDRGQASHSLYETEYGRSRAMVKGSELADLAGFYRAFGFELSDDAHEMLDHISVELEFYTLLLMKHSALMESQDQEGMEIVRDAQRKFLKDHLGRFGSSIVQNPGVQTHFFYHLVFKFCADLLLRECAELGVTVDATSWYSSEAESSEICCGATQKINGKPLVL